MGDPRRPLILAYHAVDSAWSSPLAVSEAGLDSHASYLHERGFVSLTLSQSEQRRQAGTLPPRSAVFTFDDGYRSTGRAVPILARWGFVGTVFVVTSYVDRAGPMRWFGVDHEDPDRMRSLDWTGLGDLAAAGWEIGSHTCTHPLLTTLNDRELADELRASREMIAHRLGACRALAYPYGVADSRVAAAARAAGYDVACTLTGVETADEYLRRPRLGMSAADRGVRLRVKTSDPARRLRRSSIARLARRCRRRRDWLPTGREQG